MQVSKMMSELSITVFTDGSCHNRLKSGGWASIIFIGNEKVTLKGSEQDTTHHRMELLAVLEALTFLEKKNSLSRPITIYSDSQYVVDLLQRQERLTASGYKTKKLKPIRNADLVQSMIYFFNATDLQFVKLKSHLKSSDPKNVLNREVDMLSRQMMRTTS
jgi:ribonuclease HI